jgi:hypothetical protein
MVCIPDSTGRPSPYLRAVLARPTRTDGFVDPCIPSRAPKPPSGSDWVHEVKHDGYRLIVRRDGPTVRLFTRRGYDWTERYPAIASAAAKIGAQSLRMVMKPIFEKGFAAHCCGFPPDGAARMRCGR